MSGALPKARYTACQSSVDFWRISGDMESLAAARAVGMMVNRGVVLPAITGAERTGTGFVIAARRGFS